jgi:hypothetical protein
MAVLAVTNPTLIDVASRMEDGKVASTIVELLNQTNEVITDATAVECNDGTGHKTTVRSGLPTATWRLLNYGVQPSKSRTVQVRDACGMLEAYGEQDKSLVDMSGDPNGFRMSEDAAFLEAMNQGFVTALIYGNTTLNPEKFMGLAPRYASLSAENGSNIVNAGGSGSDNTSVWLVSWSPQTCHLIYPKGSKAGIGMQDLGEQTLIDAAGGKYQGYRSHYKWDVGLSLRDWRYVVRVANIDVSDLSATAATGANLITSLVTAIELLPSEQKGRTAFYCNRTIRTYLRLQMLNKSNVNLSLEEVAGKKVLAFDGIPVRRCDAILNTEAAVA